MSAADDLRACLALCRQGLGPDVHPIWLARLAIVEQIIVWAMREGSAPADYWATELEQAEDMVDRKKR